MSPSRGLDLQNSKPICLHNTPTHDDGPHTKFGYKRLSSLQDTIWINPEQSDSYLIINITQNAQHFAGFKKQNTFNPKSVY